MARRCQRPDRDRGALMTWLALCLGIVAGGALAWLHGRARSGRLAERVELLQGSLEDERAHGQERSDRLAASERELATVHATAEADRAAAEDKLALVERARDELTAA